MCGRINVSDNEGVRLLLAMLGMEVWPSRDPRYNIAPTQTLDVVLWDHETPSLQPMKWGLMPKWAKPGKFSAPLINARSETIWEKPSFRHLITQYRVLVPINGFYEWHRQGKTKTPFYFQPVEHKAMFLAAIYQPSPEETQAADTSPEQSANKAQVCLVTTDANDTMQAVHHRMPVILDAESAMRWITPSDHEVIEKLMKPAGNDVLQQTQVGDYVNSSRNEGEQCIQLRQSNDLFD